MSGKKTLMSIRPAYVRIKDMSTGNDDRVSLFSTRSLAGYSTGAQIPSRTITNVLSSSSGSHDTIAYSISANRRSSNSSLTVVTATYRKYAMDPYQFSNASSSEMSAEPVTSTL